MQRIYVVIAVMLFALSAQAQTDSVRTEYKTEDEKISSAEIKRFIRYITRANVEEKTLVKVGFWPTSDQNARFTYQKFRIGAVAEVAIERKISPSLSFLAGLGGSCSFITFDNQNSTNKLIAINPSNRFLTEKIINYGFDWKLGTRYYYGMAKRIREGKSANNFSGNYITAQVTGPVVSYQKNQIYDRLEEIEFTNKGILNSRNTQVTRILLAYGVQRRLGRLAYLDVNAGPELRYSIQQPRRSFTFQLNALIGIGW